MRQPLIPLALGFIFMGLLGMLIGFDLARQTGPAECRFGGFFIGEKHE